MPDDVNLRYEVNVDQLTDAQKKLSKVQDQIEKGTNSSLRVVEQQVSAKVTALDASARSMERAMQSLRKQTAFELGGPVGRLRADQERYLRLVKGDPVREAEVRQLSNQRINNQLLREAQRATKDATRGSQEFAKALNQVNAAERGQKASQLAELRRRQAEASRLAAHNEDLRRAALERSMAAEARRVNSLRGVLQADEQRARLLGASPVSRIQTQGLTRIAELRNLGATTEQVNRLRRSIAEQVRVQRILDQQSQKSGDGLLAMAKRAGIAYLSFEGLRLVFKDGIFEAARYSARVEQLGIALDAVARANNITIGTTRTLERQIRALGITTSESRSALTRGIAGKLDPATLPQLARVAQNVGRVAGIPSSDAYERLIHAVITLQPELFRYLGLNISLEQAYKRQARAIGTTVENLTEQQKRQIAVNEVLLVAASYNGVYESSLKTAGGQMLSLDRYAKEFKKGFGDNFLEPLRFAIGLLNKFGKSAEEIGNFAGRLARFTLFGWIGEADIAAKNLAGVGAAFNDILIRPIPNRPITGLDARLTNRELIDVARGKFRESEQRSGKQQALDAGTRQGENLTKMLFSVREDLDKKIREAQLDQLQGIERIRAEHRQLIEDYGYEANVIERINKLTALRIQMEREKLKVTDESGIVRTLLLGQAVPGAFPLGSENPADRFNSRAVRGANDVAALAERLAVEENSRRLLLGAGFPRPEDFSADSTQIARFRADMARIGQEETQNAARRLADLDREIGYIEQKIMLEAGPGGELEAQRRITEAREQNLRQQERAGLDPLRVAEKRIEIERNGELELMRLQRQRFDDMRSSIESTIQTLLTNARGFWDAVKRMLYGAFAAPFVRMASNNLATLFTGVRGGGGGGGFSFGAPGGALGTFAGLGSLVGGPGGTGGFAGPYGGLGGGGATMSALGLGGVLGGFGRSGLGILSSLGNIGRSAFPYELNSAGIFQQVGSQAGYGGALGGALLAGGGILGALGLQRGGRAGIGMTALSGALIGLKFGGKLGAAIGAGAGAIVGLVRSFFKSAEEKVIQKVKRAYGIDIDRTLAKQIAQIAKDRYAGNLDVAIFATDVRELIELYRMATGQRGVVVNHMAPGIISQSGTSYSVGGGYYNGSPLPAGGITNAPAPPASTAPVVLNKAETAAFWQRVVSDGVVANPRGVATANVAGQKANAGRSQSLLLQLAPGAVLA